MLNVLNLALKKEVFESLQNGETNEIAIEGSNWWKKRLMDLDTGRFKDFDVACISSGSNDKLEFAIEKIEKVDNNFVITVINDYGVESESFNDDGDSDSDEPIQYSDGAVPPIHIHTVTDGNGEGIEITGIKGTQEDLLNPDGFNPVGVEDEELPDELKGEPEFVTNEGQLASAVLNLFNKFCELNNVYVVNMDNVTIRNNGQILGCKKRLVADRDSDVKFDFVKKEFIKYPDTSNVAFITSVMSYLGNLIKNSYVFVNKAASGFRTGDHSNFVFVITAISKKRYLFNGK